MRKSETGTFLPSIKPQRASLSGRSKMKSFFLERVKQQVNQESPYEAMESNLITQEQKRLKHLLRQFNDRSQSILADYIAIPTARSKEASPPKQSIQDIKKIIEQEEQILAKMREQCQNELRMLENRCEDLKYTTRQQVERHIRQVKSQLEKIKVDKRELGRNVTLNGLNICREESFDLVKELEVQKIEIDLKLTKLHNQEPMIIKDIETLKEKSRNADEDIAKMEADYKTALSQKEQGESISHRKEEIKQKAKLIEYAKSKNEQVTGALKQKYLTKLRLLEEARQKDRKMEEQVAKQEEDLERTKKQMIVLEHKLSAVKHKATTVQLLAKK